MTRSDETGPISHQEARDILGRFNASHYSIPANPRRDDDIRLAAYIEQSEKRIELLEQTLRGVIEEKRERLEERGPSVARDKAAQEIAWLERALGGEP